MQASGEQGVKTRAGVRAVHGLVSCCARPSRRTSKGDEDGEGCRVQLYDASLGKGMNLLPSSSYSTSQIPKPACLTAVQKPSAWPTELPAWHQLAAACARGSACAQGLQGEGTAECAGKACLLLQYRFGVPSPVTEGPLVLFVFSSHSINNSNARS